MSFILDALKKSENDRQRQSGPALNEAKLTAPRTQLPLWAIGLGVVLVANLGLVMWVLFRSPSHTPAAQASTSGQTSVAQPAPAQAPPQYAPNNQGFAPNAQGYPQGAPPNAQGYAPNGQAPSQPAMGAPPIQGAGTQPMQMQAPGQPGMGVPAQGSTYAGGPGAQSSNPDDYAPAAEPNNSSGFHVRRATEEGLQIYSDAAANGGLPELRVDMHTYAQKPQDRFVLINMRKAREGDMLPGGVKVESITPDGVVVSHNGSQFLLPK
jgi:general secretion pathway protein B